MHSPPPPLVLPLGTLIAISHFCKPKEGASWNFDHPRESSVLDRWELKSLFGDDDDDDDDALFENGKDGEKKVVQKKKWKIVKDDIVPDGDHGRTLIQFIAKKVA
mmetsp:Transcript_12402/g.22441  ORF Transcript_12402/g.22441 Transcript_12402/m.22441 type:complete len:105 (+) Transcript_12402:249-563(+)